MSENKLDWYKFSPRGRCLEAQVAQSRLKKVALQVIARQAGKGGDASRDRDDAQQGRHHLDVSENNGTPQIIHFNRVFHYKPSILGYPYFWNHPFVDLLINAVLHCRSRMIPSRSCAKFSCHWMMTTPGPCPHGNSAVLERWISLNL